MWLKLAAQMALVFKACPVFPNLSAPWDSLWSPVGRRDGPSPIYLWCWLPSLLPVPAHCGNPPTPHFNQPQERMANSIVPTSFSGLVWPCAPR